MPILGGCIWPIMYIYICMYTHMYIYTYARVITEVRAARLLQYEVQIDWSKATAANLFPAPRKAQHTFLAMIDLQTHLKQQSCQEIFTCLNIAMALGGTIQPR